MVICFSAYASKKILKIRRREYIKKNSQLRLYNRFNLTPTSYLVGYEDNNLDGQGDIKESNILNFVVEFESQSNPT